MAEPSRAALSRDRIAVAALSLIDRIGLAKFSMRKLGVELGADPMAAYRHFTDQEDLFDGIAETLFDECDSASLPWDGPWRELAEQSCRRMRDVLLAHPHAVSVFATRPVRSPAAIDTGNRMIAALRDAGFPPALALQVTRCLREFTIGHVLTLTVVALGGQRRSRKPAPGSPDYNLLAESADGAAIDAHFDVGLTAMLDGFERMSTRPRA